MKEKIRTHFSRVKVYTYNIQVFVVIHLDEILFGLLIGIQAFLKLFTVLLTFHKAGKFEVSTNLTSFNNFSYDSLYNVFVTQF